MDAVVVSTADPFQRTEKSRRLVALLAQQGAVEREILSHGANWGTVAHEASEIDTNVCRTVLVPV